jgi:hypothetical protein
MAIKISGTTVVDDSRNLVNINNGLGVGISSAGTSIGTGVSTLNFIGAGNTFAYNAGTNTVDISISGSGGGGGAGVSTTGIVTAAGFMNAAKILESITLTDYYGTGSNVVMVGPIQTVGAGVTINVGAGVSFVIV